MEKVWLLADKVNDKSSSAEVKKITHKTIKKVTDDIENLRFNTAISQMMILVNKIIEQKKVAKVDFELLLRILSPFAPHIAEELWGKLGHKESIFKEEWPKHDPELIIDKIITLVVQVNGKVRDQIEVSLNTTEEEAKDIVLKSKKIKKYIEGKEIKKIIFVPNKLVNIVI